MASIEWSEELSVGNELIDHHHQEVFKLVTMLDNAISQGQNTEIVETIILFLEDYVVTHFQEEEQVMTEHHYAGYDQHKEEHELFKVKVADLRNKYDAKSSPITLIFNIRQIIDLLVDHIRHVDIGIASLGAHGDHH